MKTYSRSKLYHPLLGNFIAWWLALVMFTLSSYFNGRIAWVEGHITMLIGFFIGSFWTIRLHSLREAERISKGKNIDHSERFSLRAYTAYMVPLIVHTMAEGFGRDTVIRSLACTLYIGSIFWLTFDFLLNYDRGKPLFYVSSWYRSSWLDRFFSKVGSPMLWLLSKIILFLISLWLYDKSFSW
jgi:hypothetical protein